jgi:2-iminobutanoate/2-iminopropanoate deaminase
MGRRTIEVEGLDHGAMPIPLAVTLRGLLVSGGVAGTDPATGERPVELDEEVAQLFRNLGAILEAAGSNTSDILKLTFFVRDRSIREAINREWVAMFPNAEDRPARHTLLQDLPPGMRVQAEMLAVTDR